MRTARGELNKDETAIVAYIKSHKNGARPSVLAEEVFGNRGRLQITALRRALNALRKPFKLGLITSPERGVYVKGDGTLPTSKSKPKPKAEKAEKAAKPKAEKAAKSKVKKDRGQDRSADAANVERVFREGVMSASQAARELGLARGFVQRRWTALKAAQKAANAEVEAGLEEDAAARAELAQLEDEAAEA